MKVLETGLFRAGRCDYPIVKIETRNTVDGVTVSLTTRYYHAASMTTLRTTVESFIAKPQSRTTEYFTTAAE